MGNLSHLKTLMVTTVIVATQDLHYMQLLTFAYNNKNLPGLSHPVTSVFCLFVVIRVAVDVMKNDHIG